MNGLKSENRGTMLAKTSQIYIRINGGSFAKFDVDKCGWKFEMVQDRRHFLIRLAQQ